MGTLIAKELPSSLLAVAIWAGTTNFSVFHFAVSDILIVFFVVVLNIIIIISREIYFQTKPPNICSF